MTQLNSQLITIENKSSALSPRDLFNLVWSVNYQLVFHYGRSRWVELGLAPHAHAVYLPEGAQPPVGAWHLILLDTSDQAGALGWHDDEQGNPIPFSEVFCADAIKYGATPSSVASHEAIEMVVDPDVTNPRKVQHAVKWVIVEACDAVQGNDYDIGAPEGRTTGTMVADFCLPAWWGEQLDAAPGPFSFRQAVKAPFELAPKGYISVAPVDQPSQWSQIFGSQQDRLPDWASRLPRIHGGAGAATTTTQGASMGTSAPDPGHKVGHDEVDPEAPETTEATDAPDAPAPDDATEAPDGGATEGHKVGH